MFNFSDGVSNLSTVEVYNSEENRWEFTASMVAHEGGVGVSAVVLAVIPIKSFNLIDFKVGVIPLY